MKKQRAKKKTKWEIRNRPWVEAVENLHGTEWSAHENKMTFAFYFASFFIDQCFERDSALMQDLFSYIYLRFNLRHFDREDKKGFLFLCVVSILYMIMY